MTNPTSNFGWQMPTSTDLVTDLPADFEVFGQAVDTSLADLKGGTTGQVLKKNTNADMDFVWSADSAGMTNPMTTTGDTIYSSSGSTPARLGIGTTGQVLSVVAGLPAWAAASGGKIGQVLYTGISATTALSSSTYVTHGSLSITPASTSSKILVFMIGQVRTRTAIGTSDVECRVHIFRGATDLVAGTAGRVGTYGYNASVGDAQVDFTVPCMYLDSPATASSVTYNLNGNKVSGNTSYLQDGSSILLIEVLP